MIESAGPLADGDTAAADNGEESTVAALRRDLQAAAGRELKGYVVEQVRLIGGGRSALTAVAQLSGNGDSRRVAVRAQMPGSAGLSIGSLGDQYHLLERLSSHHVKAPGPVLVAEGESDSTYDLLLTEFLDGDVPQPWRRKGRETLSRLREKSGFPTDFVESLAQVHGVAPTELPPTLAHDGVAAAQSHPERSRRRSGDWVKNSAVFADDPVLVYTSLWLEAHEPQRTFKAGLVHGDYRVGNLVLDGDKLVGILDWELAEAGEVLSDIAWLCGPQGTIDGFAGGVFTEDDLIACYETVTGQMIDPQLFRYLKVEGTLRTGAVWAQLSADESQRGNEPTARRCRDSVIDLIGQCAEVLELDDFAESRGASHSSLTAGLGLMGSALLREMSSELRGAGEMGPAVRNAQLFLKRLQSFSTNVPYDEYSAACHGLADDWGVDLDDGEWHPSPARRLSAALRAMASANGSNALSSPEVRRLIAWSAEPGTAFANLLVATTRGPGAPPDPA